MAKDVIVVVKRDALPTTKESLDILLISTTGAQPVGVYRDVESVKAVYGDDGKTPNSKIVRMATTLMNQGKTTLAETLVNKFKIVGFEPPTASPAVAATFVINFDNDVFAFDPPAAKQKLYVRIGGDDKAVVTLTAKVEIEDGMKLAAQFNGASFTKGGKTYTATVKDTVVTFTATEGGSTDSIPERIEIFLDEALSQEFVATGRKTFTNGKDAMTAADSLIETIQQFQRDEDNDWYYFMTDRDEPEFVKALAKFAEASEPSEAELGAGVEDHRKFYMGQTSDIDFADNTARAAVIYTDEKHLDEEPDASYTGNVGPFYPKNVTWKFKRPQDGNAAASEGAKLITLPKLTEGQRNQLSENHVNYLTEEYKRQYVKEGVCRNGEYPTTAPTVSSSMWCWVVTGSPSGCGTCSTTFCSTMPMSIIPTAALPSSPRRYLRHCLRPQIRITISSPATRRARPASSPWSFRSMRTARMSSAATGSCRTLLGKPC